VETLNALLDRIEQMFEVQRGFTADASHELCSPLSRLRAELEVTLRRPRARVEYEKALGSCLTEVERLSRLTDELLTLARLDAGESREGPQVVPLKPIMEEAVTHAIPEALRQDVNLTLNTEPGTLPVGFVKSSLAANASSIEPLSASRWIGSRPNVAAARGNGARPSIASQNGPDRLFTVSSSACHLCGAQRFRCPVVTTLNAQALPGRGMKAGLHP
jgi:signal transduction histidine kinase